MAIDIELRRLVNQEAHARLQGLLAMIAAADARAVGILATSISIAGISSAASLTILQIKGLQDLWMVHATLWGLAAPCICAALLATLALRSKSMVLPGFAPAAFEEDWLKTEDAVIVSMLIIGQDAIATNTKAHQHLLIRNQIAVDCLSAAPVGAFVGALSTLGGGWTYFVIIALPPVFIAFVAWVVVSLSDRGST